jgi:uncharacterized protein YlzI (FlbEa/FlbD family)
MDKFIELTTKKGDTLYLNPQNIESILRNTENERTEIRVFMREPAYSVKDTAEDVLKKIKNSKSFINYNVDKKSKVQKDSEGMEGSNSERNMGRYQG